jgi:hypothetical protein
MRLYNKQNLNSNFNFKYSKIGMNLIEDLSNKSYLSFRNGSEPSTKIRVFQYLRKNGALRNHHLIKNVILFNFYRFQCGRKIFWLSQFAFFVPI